TTVSSVEVLKAGASASTTFTVDAADLASAGSVLGNSGTDTLVVVDTLVDLRGTTASSVEVLKAGNAGDTVFTVDAGDLAKGGSLIGSAGNDTLLSSGTALDLSGTTLSGIEVLQAGTSTAATFTVD